jgi:Peptidase MA superfamily
MRLTIRARRVPAALLCSVLVALAFQVSGGGAPAVAFAQSAPQVGVQVADAGLNLPGVQGEMAAQADFGADIRFQLRLRAEDPVTSVLFLYQVDDSTVQNTAVPAYQPGASVVATYSWRVASVLVPGSVIRYQWQVETASGKRATTAESIVAYDDTRFAWRQTAEDNVTVFFPTADPQGAQAGSALLDEAKKSQARLKTDFGLTLDKPLRIYAYPRREDYASAVYTGRPLEPSLTVGTDRIFVLAPGGTSGMTAAVQSLRREIATALFVQKTQNAYAEPPRWLSVGFSYVMSGEELTPETNRALGQLAQANQLLALKTLGGNFPTADRDANLAYAESASAVQFLAATYGPEKLRALLTAYKDGNSPDDAMKKGLGVTQDQFETRWKTAHKSGQLARPGAGQAGAAANPAPTGDGGIADRVFGPALRFWQGVFGAQTRNVLIGVGAVLVLGVFTLIVGSGVSVWRHVRAANADD